MTMVQTTQRTAGNGDSPPQQAMAKRKFEPLAQVETPTGLKSLLEANRNGIAQALPKHVSPERLIKTLLVAANRNPDILRCTQSSILETINRAAELGLDLSGTLGEAYPVPFNNKVKWTDNEGRQREDWFMQLALIIGYRGLEKLAWQSGEVESIDAEVVRQGDAFTFRKGTEVFVEWSPKLDGERGDVIGAYACVKLKSGGKLARFLPKSDIEKIRASAKSKDSPAWRNWWDEMARKCALKRTLKDAPLSTEKFVAAMDHDETDYNLADVLAAQTAPQRGTAGLLNKLKAQEQLPDTQLPDDEAAAQLARMETAQEQPVSPAAAEAEQGHVDTSGIGDEPRAGNEAGADNGAPEDAEEIAIAEALTGKWDDVKTNLRNAAVGVGKTDFEGGIFKFLTARKVKAAADLPATHPQLMRELLAAIRAKTFDWKSGAILNPNAD